MFCHKWILASLLIVLMIVVVPTYAWHTEAPCPYTEGEYYRPNVAFRLRDDNQFVLYDTETEAVLSVLDDNMLSVLPGNQMPYGYRYEWSRNCRYVFALNHWKPTATWAGRNIGIYDAITGQRVAFFPGRDDFFEVRYSPDYRTMYIKVSDGSHMLGDGWSQAVFLAPYTYLATAGGQTIRQTYQMRWDMERREFIVVFRGTSRSAHIFDMNTGALKAVVSVPDECTDEVYFQTAVENSYLLVYTNRSGVPNNCVTVYNRNTGATVTVDVDTRTNYEADQIALSPDGRYLVLGMLALRVWDLQNLAPNLVDRDPIYRHEAPLSTIGAVQFIDNDTVETTSADGVQRWNIITGAQEQ
jgi:WD40 repeat protein